MGLGFNRHTRLGLPHYKRLKRLPSGSRPNQQNEQRSNHIHALGSSSTFLKNYRTHFTQFITTLTLAQ